MKLAPPRLPCWLLRTLIGGGLGDALAGDLSEEYLRFVRPTRGKLSADLWFWRQALLSLPGGFRARRFKRFTQTSRISPSLRLSAGSGAETLFQDLRYAFRGLWTRPGFTAVALATLGLGIGATTAIFSVVNSVVLRPLPYREPDRVVAVWPDVLFPFNLESGLAFRDLAAAYDELSLFGRRLFSLTGDGDPEIVRGATVLSNHFEMLGAAPVLGRGFLPEDGREGAERVVVLAHDLWQRRFGSDPSVIGRTIDVSGIPHLVVGVMAADHQPLEPDWQIWAPIQISEESLASGNGMAAVGRLRPGVTAAAAQAESRRIYRQYEEDRGESVTEEDLAGLRVVPVRDWILGNNRTLLLILLGAVGFLVLIACANVANLLLAHNGSRRQEFALRQAVGASKGRILRQLLTEAALLGTLGGAVGVVLAYAALAYSAPFLPVDLPRSNSIGIDWVVLAFALAASLTSAVLFGLVPALRAAGSSFSANLGRGSRGSMGARQLRLNHGLVAVEVALAVTLVVGAGLMLRSSWKLGNVNPGFDSEGVLTLRVAAPASAVKPENVNAFHEQVLEALRAVPGVLSVGAIQFLPMRPGGWWSVYRVLGEAEPEEPQLAMRVATRDYFSTMGIAVRSGREFTAWGRDDGAQTTLINEALARIAFPGVDPIGRQILLGMDEPQPYTIVGVVAEVSQTDLRSPSFPEAYLSLRERPWQSMFYAVKVNGEPARYAASVRAAVWSVHDRAPISSLSPLSDVVGETVASDRLFTGLLTAFGLLALLLGTVGVYGVMSYVVSQRKREIGIRMAVGASAHQLLRTTVIRGMIPVALGVAVGLSCALAASRVLSGTLFGVQPTDTLTMVAVPIVLSCAALFALYVPARRASRLDPMFVLRE